MIYTYIYTYKDSGCKVSHILCSSSCFVCFLSKIMRKMKNQWLLNKTISESSFFSHNDALICATAEQIHRVNRSSGVAQGIR